jgi:hypothetical protein
MGSLSAMEVFPCIERKFLLYGRGAKVPCIYGNYHFNTRIHGMISIGPWNYCFGSME